MIVKYLVTFVNISKTKLSAILSLLYILGHSMFVLHFLFSFSSWSHKCFSSSSRSHFLFLDWYPSAQVTGQVDHDDHVVSSFFTSKSKKWQKLRIIIFLKHHCKCLNCGKLRRYTLHFNEIKSNFFSTLDVMMICF